MKPKFHDEANPRLSFNDAEQALLNQVCHLIAFAKFASPKCDLPRVIATACKTQGLLFLDPDIWDKHEVETDVGSAPILEESGFLRFTDHVVKVQGQAMGVLRVMLGRGLRIKYGLPEQQVIETGYKSSPENLKSHCHHANRALEAVHYHQRLRRRCIAGDSTYIEWGPPTPHEHTRTDAKKKSVATKSKPHSN